jgi:hypothetical protein
MSDSNPTRRRAAVNKQAFDEVLGNPFGKEDVEGHYNRLRHRSILSATRSAFGEGEATIHPAKPTAVDLCIDVEVVINKVLGDDPELLSEFIKVYITGSETDIESSNLTQQERSYLEQRLGRLFLAHGISPVSKYFAVIDRGDKK